jgi:hypothetical protein
MFHPPAGGFQRSPVWFWLVQVGFGHSFLHAQTNRGNLLLGVSSKYGIGGTGAELASVGTYTIKNKSNNNQNSEPAKVTGINLQPKAGYFIADGFVLGLDATIYRNSRNDDDYKSTSTLFCAGPFGRYYFPGEKFMPFLEASGSFGSLVYKSEFRDYSEYNSTNRTMLTIYWGGCGLGNSFGPKGVFGFNGCI